ncbi:B-box zinc finger domain-containing protein [Toxoplasma gondii MAS]|uniref:B-box zinc finger domain-containing protein n=1 Tax=Toxoplasma gondii MAS TaxID=943118 RepID=A0A086QWF2_TOXGO|nr:B-box zinc finger domain-containing protein [Toxoplasma gondii MAS]
MPPFAPKAPSFPLAAESNRLPPSERRGLAEQRDVDGRQLPANAVEPVHPLTVRPCSHVPRRKGREMEPRHEVRGIVWSSEREELPTLLLPAPRPSASPCTENRACMSCWGRIGTLYCSECSKFLCGICALKLHASGPNQQHVINTASKAGVFELDAPKVEEVEEEEVASTVDDFDLAFDEDVLETIKETTTACSRHPEEGLTLACATCRYLPLCVKCAGAPLHQKHQIISVREAVPIARDMLNQDYSRLAHQLAQLQHVMSKLRSAKRKAADLAEVHQHKIDDAFKGLYKTIDLRVEGVNHQIRQLQQQGTQRLRFVNMQCETLRRYLVAKGHQATLLSELGKRNEAAALNAYVKLKPTFDALEGRADHLEGEQ